jgi:hypothetical protein
MTDADEAMTWDEVTLKYGYVLHRIAGGGWWHLHFGRSSWSYHCDLLGHRTDILACVQRFAPGGLAESSRFRLTLDGEGVELPEAGLDFQWGDCPRDPEQTAVARHFQREVMPRLYDSPAFQRAVAEIVTRQRHLRLVASGKVSSIEPDVARDRPRD